MGPNEPTDPEIPRPFGKKGRNVNGISDDTKENQGTF